ncbi:ABCC9, partial [Symbiodinium microadriaticum]
MGVFHAIELSVGFVSPLLIRPMIDNLDKSSLSVGLMYAIALALGPALQNVCSSQFSFLGRQVGLRCKGGASCLVFDKIVRLSQPSFAAYGQGKLSNLIQVDTSRLQDFFYFLTFLWSMPFMFVIGMSLLFNMLKWAAFVPIVIMVATYRFNKLLTKRLMTLSSKLNRARDERVKIVTE